MEQTNGHTTRQSASTMLSATDSASVDTQKQPGLPVKRPMQDLFTQHNSKGTETVFFV